jgi:hypothetical protein
MSIAENHTALERRERRRQDERAYAWVFWLAFPLFLASALWARLTRGRGEAQAGRQSVFREAWVAANSSIPFAFMN